MYTYTNRSAVLEVVRAWWRQQVLTERVLAAGMSLQLDVPPDALVEVFRPGRTSLGGGDRYRAMELSDF